VERRDGVLDMTATASLAGPSSAGEMLIGLGNRMQFEGYSMAGISPVVGLDALFTPLLAFARDDRVGLRALIVRTAWWTLFGAARVALSLWVIADPIQWLLGPGFSDGVSALRILLLGQLFASAAAGPGLFLLTMTGYERETALMQAVVAAANMALPALFIWQAALEGAVVAATIMRLGLTARLALLIWHKLCPALGLIARATLRGPSLLARGSTVAAVQNSAEVSLAHSRSSAGD
jgi:O-antigen/teichoic acid export membrane protein